MDYRSGAGWPCAAVAEYWSLRTSLEASKAPLPGARGSFGRAQQSIGAAPAKCRAAKQTRYSRAAWLKSSQKPWQR